MLFEIVIHFCIEIPKVSESRVWNGNLTLPESVFAVGLQIIHPLVPSFLLALFHINVLFTIISLFVKSKSFISNARSSLIRNAEASKELQMVINRRLALLLGRVFKNANHVF